MLNKSIGFDILFTDRRAQITQAEIEEEELMGKSAQNSKSVFAEYIINIHIKSKMEIQKT